MITLKTLRYRNINALAVFFLLLATNLQAQQEVMLEKVVAIVDDDVVLQSELRAETTLIKKQLATAKIELPPENVLQKQILERLIIIHLQLQEAEKRGIKIDDISLNESLRDIATRNKMNLEQFRQQLIRDGIGYAEYREDLRRKMLIRRLTQSVVNKRVIISEQEIEDYINTEKSENENSEYLLSQIEITIPEAASPDQISTSKKKANSIHKKLLEGEDFAELAIAESDGRRALDGGSLGWRKLNQLPSLFSKEIRKLKAEEFSKPIRTPRGFHILMLNDTKGVEQHMVKQTKARHILTTTNTLTDDAKARGKLSTLRTQIINGADFATVAKQHSEDSASAVNGGDLGWSEPGIFVAAFSKVLNALPVNKISEPFKSRYGWHIVEVLARRDYDKTVEYQRGQARRNIFKRKAVIEEELWIRRLRDQAYVEYRLDA